MLTYQIIWTGPDRSRLIVGTFAFTAPLFLADNPDHVQAAESMVVQMCRGLAESSDVGLYTFRLVDVHPCITVS